MNDKLYPNWAGVILGFLLNGCAHFLAGERVAGIRWYFTIALTATVGVFLLALPGVASLTLALILLFTAFILWLIMMRQSYRPVRRIGFVGWIAVIVISIILSFAWDSAVKQVVRPLHMPSTAMAPALNPGDHVIAESISYRLHKPKRGDIVVFNTTGINHPDVTPDTLFIKRIVGLPNETVQIKPPHLLINGSVVTEPPIFTEIASRSNGFLHAAGFIKPPPPLSTPDDILILGDDEYFTIGDNMTASFDGRHYGAIKDKQIYGRVRRVYWPLSRINSHIPPVGRGEAPRP